MVGVSFPLAIESISPVDPGANDTRPVISVNSPRLWSLSKLIVVVVPIAGTGGQPGWSKVSQYTSLRPEQTEF